MKHVVLVHGLWTPGLFMQPLALRLEGAGFRCHTFAYHGRRRPLEAHAERLARFARDLGSTETARRLHFVGHSLGGLVVMEALRADPSLGAARVVLLGTPARGCLSGRHFARHAPGRWLLGESARVWREGRSAYWTRPEPLGVIAGSTPFGLGRMIHRLPRPNDGVVCVDETAVEGMAEQAVMPVSHSAMLISGRVADKVRSFLVEGRFHA